MISLEETPQPCVGLHNMLNYHKFKNVAVNKQTRHSRSGQGRTSSLLKTLLQKPKVLLEHLCTK